MFKYLYRYLKLPIAALLLAGGIVVLADRYVETYPIVLSLVDKILIAAGIFCILLAIKNHFSQVRLVSQARKHLDGISEFERDISTRLDSVSAQANNTQPLSTFSERMDNFDQKLDKISPNARPDTEFRPVNENIPFENILRNPKIIPISSGLGKRAVNEIRLNTNRSSDSKPSKRPLRDLQKHLDNGKLQMYLQPALTLPDRVITHYEAFARLELGNERVIKCGDFLAKAEKSGLITEIDQQMLFKVIQLLRQLKRNGLQPGIFWNLSHSSLASKKVFTAITEVLKANSVLCPQILVEISQSNYQSLKQSQLRRLSTLRELGVHLSIDQCDDLALLGRLVNSGLFSFIKIPVGTLTGYEGSNHELQGGQIARQAIENGIKLVATHVEEEFQVLQLIDQDVSMGQGYLFSKPRPVKNQPAIASNKDTIVSR